MPRAFAITYDYLCPFARNANEAIVEAIDAGADLNVFFIPFSLNENHADEGDTPQWDLPLEEVGTGVLALLWSIAVRDAFSDVFPAFHVALFGARHDDGADINDEAVIRSVAVSVGLDPDRVRAEVATGLPAKTLAAEHRRAVDEHGVFGVPTFVDGDHAVFVRFIERHNVEDLERVLDMLSWSNLNEFKRTSIEK